MMLCSTKIPSWVPPSCRCTVYNMGFLPHYGKKREINKQQHKNWRVVSLTAFSNVLTPNSLPSAHIFMAITGHIFQDPRVTGKHTAKFYLVTMNIFSLGSKGGFLNAGFLKLILYRSIFSCAILWFNVKETQIEK